MLKLKNVSAKNFYECRRTDTGSKLKHRRTYTSIRTQPGTRVVMVPATAQAKLLL